MELERIASYFDSALVARTLDIVEHQNTLDALAAKRGLQEWQARAEYKKIDDALKSGPKLAAIAEDIRNYQRVRAYAEFQRRAQYSNHLDLETLAGAGLLGAVAQEIVANPDYEGPRKLERREFLKSGARSVQRTLESHPLLKFALPGAVYVVSSSACSDKNSENPMSPTPIPPPDNYLNNVPFTIPGLITGMPLSGVMRNNAGGSVPFTNGSGVIMREHKFTPGQTTLTLESIDGKFYTRSTGAMLTSQGPSIALGDGRTVLLDVVENDAITGFQYARYLGAAIISYSDGQQIGYRWNTKPRFFLYDRTFWEHVYGGEFRKVETSRALLESNKNYVIDVCMKDPSQYSDGFANNNIVLESQSSERPEFHLGRDWMIFVPVLYLPPPTGIRASSKFEREAVINYVMEFVGDRTMSRWGFSSDTWQGFGYNDQSLGWDGTDKSTGMPTLESMYWGRIKYNRKAGHNSTAVPDNQS